MKLTTFYVKIFLTDGDFKKIEKIKEAVLMSSVSREKRKERVRKYLQWVSVRNVSTLREKKDTVELSGKWSEIKNERLCNVLFILFIYLFIY